jgi:catechol 2,3-dioxygenase-like lactoylglutathione lyase family enzyme
MEGKMSNTQTDTTPSAAPTTGEVRLEIMVLPVADVDRSKDFYTSLRWRLDADYSASDGFRVVQLTPPGSQASIIFGNGVTAAAPGSVERLLVAVQDIDAARDELLGHGVEASGVFHREGTDPAVPGPAEGHADYGSFVAFSDPDGNGWVLQEIRHRLANRVDDRTGDPFPGPFAGEFRLEAVTLPVADVDRSKAFYESLGWRLDADFEFAPGARAVQLTPPGSGASIHLGGGTPGSLEGLVLVVSDIDAARDDLVARGVEVSEVWHDAGGVFYHAGTDARVAGPADGRADYGSFASFSDPDGNGWLLQEIKQRLPGR